MQTTRYTIGSIALLAGITLALTAQTPPQPPDKYQWLEDVNGPRSLAWVKTENERSAKTLESDPHFRALEAAELKVLESPDRLPTPTISGNNSTDS